MGFTEEQIASIRAKARESVQDAPPIGEVTSSRLLKMLSISDANAETPRRMDAAG